MKLCRALALVAFVQLSAAQTELRGSTYCELWVVEPVAVQPPDEAPLVTVLVLLTGSPTSPCDEGLFAGITFQSFKASLPQFANATALFKNGPREWVYDTIIRAPWDTAPTVFVTGGLPFIAVAFSTLPEALVDATLTGQANFVPKPVIRTVTAVFQNGNTQYRLLDTVNHVTWQMQALSKIRYPVPWLTTVLADLVAHVSGWTTAAFSWATVRGLMVLFRGRWRRGGGRRRALCLMLGGSKAMVSCSSRA
eukprot:scaffold7350_cov233-Pinguiococcus_pyrenoidosus.AAC.1